MPGIIASIIMSSMMKGKPNNTRYRPRDYEAVREQARKNSTRLSLPPNTLRERRLMAIGSAGPIQIVKRSFSTSTAVVLTAAARNILSIWQETSARPLTMLFLT